VIKARPLKNKRAAINELKLWRQLLLTVCLGPASEATICNRPAAEWTISNSACVVFFYHTMSYGTALNLLLNTGFNLSICNRHIRLSF